VTCGVGHRQRVASSGDCAPDIDACDAGPCDCVYDTWAQWGDCQSESCGTGLRSRARDVIAQPRGLNCDGAEDVEQCEVACTCDAAEWTPWQQCPVTCRGPGASPRRERHRDVWRGAGCATVETSPCLVPACARPCSERSAHMTTSCDADSGHACTVRCEDGYRPVEASAICADGVYLQEVGCEPVSCDEPPVVANALDLSRCAGIADGGECRVRCITGFELTGGPLQPLQCSGGKWLSRAGSPLDSDICTPLSCGPVPAIPHGVGDCAGPGECEEFGCEPHFALTEPLACIAGNWNHPRCVPGDGEPYRAPAPAPAAWRILKTVFEPESSSIISRPSTANSAVAVAAGTEAGKQRSLSDESTGSQSSQRRSSSSTDSANSDSSRKNSSASSTASDSDGPLSLRGAGVNLEGVCVEPPEARFPFYDN
jgi:hypothetical protein